MENRFTALLDEPISTEQTNRFASLLEPETPKSLGLKEPEQIPEQPIQQPKLNPFSPLDISGVPISLLPRFGKVLYNDAIARTLHTLGKSDMTSLDIEAHNIQKQRMKEREGAGINQNEELLTDELNDIKTQLTQRPETRESEDVAKVSRVFSENKPDVNPFGVKVEPAKNVAEKITDVAAGITAFIAQLAVTRNLAPTGTPEPVIWELQSLANGGKAGEGAAIYALYATPEKLLAGWKPATKLGKGLKATTETVSQSVLFGGQTAMGGGSATDILISAGVPFGFVALRFTKQGKTQEAVAAAKEYNPNVSKMTDTQIADTLEKTIKIAEKEQPSRKDFERLGIRKLNAEQRRQASIALRDALIEPQTAAKPAEPTITTKTGEIATEVKPEAAEKKPKITTPERSFETYQKSMPNATEQEIVKALIEDGLRPPKEMLKKYGDLPEVKDVLEEDRNRRIVKLAAQKSKGVKQEVPKQSYEMTKAEKGKPYIAILYRGTSAQGALDEGIYGKASYFSPNRGTARNYADSEANVKQYKVILTNPFVATHNEIRDIGENLAMQESGYKKNTFTQKEFDESVANHITNELKGRGHDGVVLIDKTGEVLEVATFARPQVLAEYPELKQVKSKGPKVKSAETQPKFKGLKTSYGVTIGDTVQISDKPSTAHLTDAAGKTGKIIDIQMSRGKPSSWAIDIDGKEYIVDASKDMMAKPKLTEGIIPYSRSLIIRNLDSLPKGLGARYLEVIRHENAQLVAKQWRRSPVVREGTILVDMEPKKSTLDTLGGRMPATDISAKMPISQEVGTVKSKSVMLQRLKDRLAGHAEVDLTYKPMSLDVDAEKAVDFVTQNPMEARQVAIGYQSPPAGITDTSIRFAYEDMVEAAKNYNETSKAVNSIKLTGIRKGQEIAAYRGKVLDTSLQNFANIVIENKMEAVGKTFGKGKEGLGAEKVKERIQQETVALDAKLAGKPIEEQKAVLADWAEKTATPKQKKSGNWQTVLEKINEINEQGLLDPASRRAIISDLIAEKMGVTVTPAEIKTISEQADNLTKLKESLIAKQTQTLPNKEYFEKLTAANVDFYGAVVKLDRYLNSLTPTHQLKVLTGGISRASMLANLPPAVLNQISNTVQGVMQALERRIASGQYTGKNADFARKYLKMQIEVFDKTGYDMSRDYPEDMRLGENIIHSEGPGVLRAYNRGLSKIVYKYLLGYSDVGSAAYARADSTNIQTTKIARKMGLKGEVRTDKALEIFKDSIQITPKSNEAKFVREQSISDAQRATWTNDAGFAEFSKKMRNLLNSSTGDLQLGYQIMPFIKTNANVLQGSIESTGFGGVAALVKLPRAWRAMNDPLVSNMKPMQDVQRLAVRAGIGMTLAYLVTALIPPEDFFTAYDVMSQRQRDQLGLKKGVYNAVKIGGKWISLDYFGALGSGFVGMMYARKYGNGIIDTTYQYSRGVVGQALQVPGMRDFADLYTSIRDMVKSSTLAEATGTVASNTINFIRSRVIPGIVSTTAQATDTLIRQTDKLKLFDRTKYGIPGLRQTLPARINRTTGEEVKGEGFWTNMLFGNRVKTANESALIDEITRLDTAGFAPTISDIERPKGGAKELKEQIGEEKFQEALKFFGTEYGRRASNRIETEFYKNATDEEKMKILNKVRDDVLDGFTLNGQKFPGMLRKFGYRKPKSKGLK